MEKSKKIYLLTIIFLMWGIGACSKEESAGAPVVAPAPEVPTPGGGTVPATPPVVSASAPLQLRLSTKFDTSNYNYLLTFAHGTDTCAVSAATPVVNCTVVVPEGRLYFSSVSMAFSWLPNNCRIMTFQPYYYLASTSGSYIRPGEAIGGTGLDCTGTVSPIGTGCYGGAAPLLVPDFPNKRALIYLPDETDLLIPEERVLTLDSGFSVTALSNRHAVNDLPAAKWGNTYSAADLGGAGDGYLPNTYADYKFSCRDNWADPEAYVINLFIQDEDTSAAGPNDFLTWKELP